MILAEDREGAVVRRAGSGADALGDLLLHHDGDRGEGLRLQELRQHRRRDIVGQIRTGKRPQPGKPLPRQRGQIQLQGVGKEELQILKRADRPVQNRTQTPVDLHRDDLAGPEAELLGQGAEARADLQYAGGRIRAGFLRNAAGNPVGDQKVLAFGLGEVKAGLLQQSLHGMDVTEIQHGTLPVSLNDCT